MRVRGRLTSTVATTVLAGLVLVACGSSTPSAEPVGQAPAETPADETRAAETPADERAVDGSGDDAASEDEAAAEQTDAQPPTTTLAPVADDEPAGGDEREPVDEPAAITTTTELEPEPAIVDECSTDGSSTALEVADGPAPELAVTEAAAATASPLPDLAVRRINCGGGWVQLRNEIPADRALLVWAWAPH